ncbi:MAG TPA: zinc-binding dehydrogenase [Acidobacteriota bacterium]|nr:zinc-binding dehydrogenase [Acidobacteriota bacterium]
MRALILDGIGFDHLRVASIPIPVPGPRQMLARVDAAGICTSLIKLVEQGPDHKLVHGWDAKRYPLTLGDEGTVTLVSIGAELRDRYSAGERFVIQPAVDHPPINNRERYRDGARGIEKVSVGYTLAGHLAEYILVCEEILAAGCLLPVPGDSLPFAHAAISEPLSCVISAQDHHVHLMQESPLSPRQVSKGLKRDGVTVIVGAGVMGRMHVDLALNWGPRAIVIADLVQERLSQAARLFGERARNLGIGLHTVDPMQGDLKSLVDKLTDYRGADDVIVAVGSRKAIEEAQTLAGRGAVFNLFGGLKKGEDVIDLDSGIVHYREINVTGSSGGSPWDIVRTLDLISCGKIDAASHITRIGDLEHAVEFLRLIRAREIDGKAVVYPHKRTREIITVGSWTRQNEINFLKDATNFTNYPSE